VDERLQPLADSYRRWGAEARGRSELWLEVVEAIAEDPEILGILAELPRPKQQPNLILAAVKYLCGVPRDYAEFRRLFLAHEDEAVALMLARRTQTNEPGRCATLLPALARLPAPLALIEVGASAGLTLLFDRYSYDYAGRAVTGSDPDAPTLRCAAVGPVPVPERPPEIVWRAGLDLNPLDVTSDDDVRWLSCLVWPGESDREQRLAAAVASARRDPPPVYRGDLLSDLPALAAQAPAGATLVIYHSAVLAYVAQEHRWRFFEAVRRLPAVWLSNEAPGVVPGMSAPPGPVAHFVLAQDGRQPLALTDGHGAWVQWLAGAS
jgi:hypothetical protein